MAEYLVYDANNFPGLKLDAGSTTGNIVQCDGFDAVVSQNATTLYHGFLTKYPKTKQVGDTIGTETTRGLFMFVPQTYGIADTKAYLQGFSDGTMRQLLAGAWTTLNAGLNTLSPYDFDQFTPFDRMFWTNGRTNTYKWSRSWATATPLRDKEATPAALAGTITFTNGSKEVVGVGSSFTTEITSGSWIRRAATEYWYEVESVTNDLNLVLVENFLELTGAGGLGTSQSAATTTVRGRFIKVWKDRAFMAAGDISAVPIVGIALVGDVATPLP